MKILVSNKEAVLKKGTSFEYISENRLFTGADSYSLSISFPLKGCQQNIDIFGNLKRKDVTAKKTLFDCEIVDKNIHVYGSLTIVDMTESEVKTQFLEGRSVTNYYTELDEIYINELDLGTFDEEAHFMPEIYWKEYSENQEGWVALPWVNNTSGNIQNNVEYNTEGKYWQWVGSEEFDLSPQFYLLKFAQMICDAIEYSYDFTKWEESDFVNLIVINTFPQAWDYRDIAAVLPHWSITEFFEELEKFMNCKITIDQKKKKISLSFIRQDYLKSGVYTIEDVVDEFTAEVDEDREDEYIESCNLAYEDADNNMSKYYSCDWLVKQMIANNLVTEWEYLTTMADRMKTLAQVAGKYTDVWYNRLHYCKEVEMYFLWRCWKGVYDKSGNVKNHFMKLVPVNVFGPRLKDNATEDDVEKTLKIVPAWLDEVDTSILPFLECGTYGESDNDDDDKIAQPFVMSTLSNGESEGKTEYFNKLYVAFWDNDPRTGTSFLPHPCVDIAEIQNDFSVVRKSFSMRLTTSKCATERKTNYKIDSATKYTFKFLANEIPDVGRVFMVKGKKYLCEKLTATFTENGMSQLIKGEFYRIV